MSRREIVVLVSRAIALLQIIAALMIVIISLPEEVVYLSQRIQLNHSLLGLGTHSLVLPSAWPGIIATFAHMGILLVIAAFFWRCGPTIERLLLPESSPNEGAAEQI